MNLWPEKKVIDLMEIAFNVGAINLNSWNVKKRGKFWKNFKENFIDERLKYVNPDPRCTHPVNLGVIYYCWRYAEMIDKGKEIDMNEFCEWCEFFKKEIEEITEK